ncbi:MAG: oxygen-independent coproporphyrinogen III oxidase [Deltaproteobacteria bacterium]|nr:oxygen-independent coproporphyrinogen III oxidase [Deltaproteobacteria bacterium]
MLIDPALISKYNTQGPRYTSYPTVPQWTAPFSSDYLQSSLSKVGQDLPLSLYVHIPFCEQLCLFCGCHTIITRSIETSWKYLKLLEIEFRLLAENFWKKPLIGQLHWGGGTPNFLSSEQIRYLFGQISDHFSFAADAEISIECDPNVLAAEQLETLSELGFNRISFGLQDLDPTVQKTINRIQTYEKTAEAVDHSRTLGFRGINIDLIYGLPYQTVESFRTTLELVSELSPDRIALYSFAYLPSIKVHQKAIPEEKIPKGGEKLAIFLEALTHFSSCGMEYIGLDHFAKREDELSIARRNGKLWRNFMGYTVNKTGALFGTGVSGITMTDDNYAQNSVDRKSYESALLQGILPIYRGIALNDDDKLRRDVIQSLMCFGKVDLGRVGFPYGIESSSYFSKEMEALDPLAKDGLIRIDGTQIDVTDIGRLFVRNIAMLFDRYLEREAKSFSSTI